MNNLEIFIRDGKTNFVPGETIAGEISWQLQSAAKALELRLIWFTEGKGTSDISVEQTQRVEAPALTGQQKFSLQLPPAPYSFAGKLIELSWALELVAMPGADAARADFVLAPNGRAVTLGTESGHDIETNVPNWIQKKLNSEKPSSIQSKNPFETSTSNRR
jgi:hypothetical protein